MVRNELLHVPSRSISTGIVKISYQNFSKSSVNILKFPAGSTFSHFSFSKIFSSLKIYSRNENPQTVPEQNISSRKQVSRDKTFEIATPQSSIFLGFRWQYFFSVSRSFRFFRPGFVYQSGSAVNSTVFQAVRTSGYTPADNQTFRNLVSTARFKLFFNLLKSGGLHDVCDLPINANSCIIFIQINQNVLQE